MVKQFETLLSSRSNYSENRKFLSTANLPCLPYFGLFLTDLTFVTDGNADSGNFGFHNLLKRRKQHEILQLFAHFRTREFVFHPVLALQTYVHQLQPLSEDERYSLAIALANKT